MDKNSKVCIACHKEQPLEKFWKDRGAPGGRVARCKDCHAAGKISQNRALSGPRVKVPDEIASTEVDFDFLADFKRQSKIGWQLNEVKLLLIKIKEASENQIVNFDKIFAAYGSGHKKSGCLNIIAEIKKLSIYNRELKEKNKPTLTLEEYWKTRIFKFGNEELAPAKPNGKKLKK